MGFDNDCVLNIQSLAGEYFCPVCHLLVYPNEALQAQCTHLYCKPCLTYVVSTTQACPYDGYRVTEADSKPLLESNQALGDTIGKIQVHCLYYRTGCTWEGSLVECTSHCSTCGFGESPVQCNRCGIQIVHRQVQEHAQNCPGVQSQAQVPGVVQNSTSAGSGVASDQGQIAGQTVAPALQTHATQASVSSVSTQDTNQQTNSANSAVQPLVAQAPMPTPEQWYQQQQQQYQQQYQQYYQQYPAYDPYQQQQQYYYQYPQAVQPPMQAYGQAQIQPQPQSQQQGQVNIQPQHQAPPQAVQPQTQPQAQPAVNSQSEIQSAAHAQPQMQVQSQGPPYKAVSYNQTPLSSQGQPYAQQQPVSQQMPVPQYQQAHPQMQHSYPLPYQQSQTQHHPHPQSQAQPHPHQAPAFPPSQVDQPMHPSAQFQAQSAVSGYQSYPQPQLHPQAHQMPTGAQQQPQYHGQMQGQFPPQGSQVRPSQTYAAVPHQQQPAHGQAPSGPSALPVYSQQPGYPFQQRPGVQALQQAPQQQYMQQQSIPGQGAFVQPQIHPQGPSQIQTQLPQQHQQNYAPSHGLQPNTAQSHGGRQVVPQSAGSQPYAQAAGAGTAGPGYVRPTQSQTYPIRTNSQSAYSEQHTFNAQNSSKTTKYDMLNAHTVEGVQNQNNHNEEAIGAVGKSVVVTQVDEKVKSENDIEDAANGSEIKRDLSLSSASELPGPKQVSATQSKPVEPDVQECKPGTIENTVGRVLEPSPGGSTNKGEVEDTKNIKKVELQDLKHIDRGKMGASVSASVLPQSHLPFQSHGLNSYPAIDQVRPQFPSVHYGPSGQQRSGLPSKSQSMSHHGNPQQQPALRGHPNNQLRPQGPGQVHPQLPFDAADNFQPPIKHPPSAHENKPVGILGPGSSGAVGGLGSAGHYQGHIPPYQAGQLLNLQGESFTGPSLAAQRPHVGMLGRESMRRPDAVQQRPLYPPEIEKFPVQRSGYFDDGLLDSHIHAPTERGAYGSVPFGVQSVAMKPSGPLAHDLTRAPGMRDERIRPFPEEHLKPFSHREVEGDLRKFPRPPLLEAGPSKIGTRFPSSGPLDHGSHRFGVDGLLRPFENGPHGLDSDSRLKIESGVGRGPSKILLPVHPNDVGSRAQPEGFADDMSRPEFWRRTGPGLDHYHVDSLPPRRPGVDYPIFSSRTFGGYRDIDNNESRSFGDSRQYNFPGEPLAKSGRKSRFPIPPNHFHSGELDVSTNLSMGDHFHGGPHNRDMPAGYSPRGGLMGPHNLHLGKGTASSRSAGPFRPGEPPFAQHIPFGEAFGGEKAGHPLAGEQAYRSSNSFKRYASDGGFYQVIHAQSLMCRICKVECGTVEGLDLHSQTSEHQRKAVDMVRSIKHRNKKILKNQAIVEGRGGEKPKSSSFENRGHKKR